MKAIRNIFIAILIVTGLFATGCTNSDYQQRQQQNEQVRVQGESMEQKNLKEKIRRDEQSGDRIGYVYLMAPNGGFIGYYTIKGKISSDSSQLAPEDEIVCRFNTGESCQAVDGPQDDNTFGEGDPGIFFFTTEGAMVVFNGMYLYADQPISTAIKVPKLN